MECVSPLAAIYSVVHFKATTINTVKLFSQPWALLSQLEKHC